MKIFKGIIGAIIFAAATFWIGFFIYDSVSSYSTQKTIVIFTLFICIGMARLGYSVGFGYINKFEVPNFVKKINLKKLRIIIYVLSVSLLIINQIMLNLSGKNITYTMLYIFSLILFFIVTNFIFFKFIKGETK